MPESREPVEEIKEPELSLEEAKEQELSVKDDAEQVRVHSLNLPGTPLKYMIIRSSKDSKEVIKIPQYYALKDKDEIIGYQRWGEEKIIQDRGSLVSVDEPVIIGERERGE